MKPTKVIKRGVYKWKATDASGLTYAYAEKPTYDAVTGHWCAVDNKCVYLWTANKPENAEKTLEELQ